MLQLDMIKDKYTNFYQNGVFYDQQQIRQMIPKTISEKLQMDFPARRQF